MRYVHYGVDFILAIHRVEYFNKRYKYYFMGQWNEYAFKDECAPHILAIQMYKECNLAEIPKVVKLWGIK